MKFKTVRIRLRWGIFRPTLTLVDSDIRSLLELLIPQAQLQETIAILLAIPGVAE